MTFRKRSTVENPDPEAKTVGADLDPFRAGFACCARGLRLESDWILAHYATTAYGITLWAKGCFFFFGCEFPCRASFIFLRRLDELKLASREETKERRVDV